ncbi:helix-turn-helix transcriptional regulator [Nocardia paucivorans]|uniref:helix-turn-helix transcriptional regulator n=1 Tax=Nocardia paucivorans TaxID=114259 RepID=UPI0002E16FC0|nr:helix-turn-helix transcriptional regulator [Nocardia paucivorans]
MTISTFQSDDLGVTEEFLSSTYTRIRIGSDSRHPRATISRIDSGTVSVDDVAFDFEMDYRADPLGKVCLCSMETGTIEARLPDCSNDTFGPGDTALLAPLELPFSGTLHHVRYTIAMFDPRLLDQVAESHPGREREPVRLTGHRPVSAATARSLRDTIAHLRDNVLADPLLRSEPLVVANATRYLAAITLTALPNNTHTEPTSTDTHDAHPDTLRRAIAYLDAHIAEDISVADIASAAHVTIRAVQLAFRRHLDTTPMAYLRRMRLQAAHEQLRAASPENGQTVTAIAARWGFAHPGRFAAEYRRAYGRSPSAVLRG